MLCCCVHVCDVRMPCLLAGDVTLVVDDVLSGSLTTLSPQQYRVALPRVDTGRSLKLRAWVRARVKGSVSLAAVLLCPSGVTVSQSFTFEEPFEIKCR